MLGQTDFANWMRNSLQIAIATTLFALVIGSLGGYAMSRWRFRGRILYGNTLLMVQMFPGVMLGIPLFLVLDNYGLIDTMWALLVTYLTFALAFSVWMLKGYFDGIPGDRGGGADRRREPPAGALADRPTALRAGDRHRGRLHVSPRLERVLLRLPLPRLAPQDDAHPRAVHLFRQYTTDWGYIIAAGILTCLPALVFFFLLQRALTRGLIAGAMKG